jgi:NAD(P)-dependent dehydrogenase (short-subunit alcohol dehydrogenase family)
VRKGALSGKTAVVVGASSGIGLTTANLFADAGATVHAAARRREAIEESAGERIGSDRMKAYTLDVSDSAAVERVIVEIGEAGGIDTLVIAAGMNVPERRLQQLSSESWDSILSVNLSGAFY